MNKNPSKNWLQQNGPDGHMLAHITPKEGKILQYFGGSGTKDKKTGLKSYFLSGLLGGAKPPAPATSRNELDQPVKDMRDKVLTSAGEVMDSEYEGYDVGDRNAGMSADTGAAHDIVRGMAGTGQEAYAAGAKVGEDATGYASDKVGNQSFLSGKGVGEYMNPHTSAVIGGLQDNAMKSMQMGRNQIGASSQMAGAGMGSRAALEKGAMAGQVMNNLNQQTGQMLNQSYRDASNMKKYDMDSARGADEFNVTAGHTDAGIRDRGAKTMMAGTTAGRDASTADATNLSNVGANIENREQLDKDFEYDEFGRKRDHKKNMTMFGSNVLGGAPSGSSVTSNNPMSKSSPLVGAAGAGLAAYGATGNPYIAGGSAALSLLS
jgi:hypothetical protein